MTVTLLLFHMLLQLAVAGEPPVAVNAMAVNGEPVEGSEFRWMVSLRAEFPDHDVQISSSNCSWIRNNGNVEGEDFVGFASSPDDCIQMVREYCPWANIANIHEDAFNGSTSQCYCQWGSNQTVDAGTEWYSCFFEDRDGMNSTETHHHWRLCGGALIHKEPIVIVTAASCFGSFEASPSGGIYDDWLGDALLFADLGRTKGPHFGNQYDETGDEWTEILISEFSSIHIHPLYDVWTPSHDIALVVVDDAQSLPSDYAVATIPEHISLSSECCVDHETMTVLGYGVQLDHDTASETMGKMSMEFISMEECRHLIDEHGWWWYSDGFDNDRVCAMAGNVTAGICTDFEDGGGPLFRVTDDGEVEVVALFAPTLAYWYPPHCDLHSSSVPTVASPSLFTSVGHYNAWISSVIHRFDDSWVVPPTESPTPSPTGSTGWWWPWTTDADHLHISTADCHWVRNDGNWLWQELLGDAESPDDCIQMVREQCSWANIANIHEDAFVGSTEECWCQSGADQTPQPSSDYFSCFFAESSFDAEALAMSLGVLAAIIVGSCCFLICVCIGGCVYCGYCCGNRNRQRDQIGGSRPEGAYPVPMAAPVQAFGAYPAAAQGQAMWNGQSGQMVKQSQAVPMPQGN